ncbi:hypothetical protein FQV26_11965 [Planococcus sp. CPCC 101016]|uniref:hypothetical protein n=1 Tax=Planococcus sp. CPCC 101016 TaxID=2599617 RepID=UPI0011B7981D|nr:hypothetical protein [Planococcus sp. CPCC 101016]TWT08492.1 hypothetical protein FQV26_11965 [Planococcus sp. CPCC 101016]
MKMVIFLMAASSLVSCVDSEEHIESHYSSEEKTGTDEQVNEQKEFQEIRPEKAVAVNRIDKGKEGWEENTNEILEKLLLDLQEEQWEMATLQLKDPMKIDVPSDDFTEPRIAHAVLSKEDHSMNYAWLEINEMNSKFNTVWQKHWGSISNESAALDRKLLIGHLTSIQRKYESLLEQVRYMEFKSSTKYAQHLHDYKLYLEGAILYRIEAASNLHRALETGQRSELSVKEAVEAAAASEAYAELADAELANYQRSFRPDLNLIPE